jgi:hypothetical protein
LLLFVKKQSASFSEEKEAKRLLFAVLSQLLGANCHACAPAQRSSLRFATAMPDSANFGVETGACPEQGGLLLWKPRLRECSSCDRMKIILLQA